MVLRGGVLAGGRRADVAVDFELGVVLQVGTVEAQPGDHVEPVDGMVLLPAAAEPHAHLDKAFLAVGAPGALDSPGGDLAAAIAAMRASDAGRRADEVTRRAGRALRTLVAHGVTAVRTHVDVRSPFGVGNLRALAAVRQWVTATELADLQLVALVDTPLTGTAGAGNRRLLRSALDAGADVVGGCPYRDPDPRGATALLLQAAADAGVGVDLHTDETIDPKVLTVAELAMLVAERGPGAGATASHCVSLGMQPLAVQRRIAAGLAEAGVSVVTLPQTNLFLQGRQVPTAVPRGLTALPALLQAGVTVAGGSDNARDPFCSAGRLDPCETAALLVMAGHLAPAHAWHACSSAARVVMGLPAADLTPGSAADLVAIEGADLLDAVAGASERRVTVHRGRVVARTEVDRQVGTDPPFGAAPMVGAAR